MSSSSGRNSPINSFSSTAKNTKPAKSTTAEGKDSFVSKLSSNRLATENVVSKSSTSLADHQNLNLPNLQPSTSTSTPLENDPKLSAFGSVESDSASSSTTTINSAGSGRTVNINGSNKQVLNKVKNQLLDSLGKVKKSPETTDFGELLQGRIDIIEYLQTEQSSSSSSSSNSSEQRSGANSVDHILVASSNNNGADLILDDKTALQQASTLLLTAPPSAVLHHQPTTTSNCSVVVGNRNQNQHSSSNNQNNNNNHKRKSSLSTPLTVYPPPPSTSLSSISHHLHPQQQQQQQHSQSSTSSSCASSTTAAATTTMYPMDGRHHFGARLPDSPPETDSGSGAGSAGSPSSASETSPCSPEFQNRGKKGGPQQQQQMNNGQSVIRHPATNGVGGGPGAGGVILDPTLAQLAQQSDLMMVNAAANVHAGRLMQQQFTNNNNNNTTNNNTEFYPPPQPTPGALAPQQVSPPSANGAGGANHPSCGTPSPYLHLPQSVMDPNTSSSHQQQQQQQQQNSVVGQTGSNNNNNNTNNNGQTGNYNPDGSLSRKRIRSDSTAAAAAVANMAGPKRPDLNSPRTSIDAGAYDDLEGYQQQCIRFNEFHTENWTPIFDQTGRELARLGFHVVADKGFNFSQFDGTFVNQKKNHFQISVHIEAHDPCPPKYVRVNGELKPIAEFRLNFYGVKAEMLSSTVTIKQSQTDRKPVPYEPVHLDLPASRVTKVTVARLHFSETTMNNQRKNGRPNPDQKFFQLAVALDAKLINGDDVNIISHASEKVIVRASNPGQFDNGESDVPWQKGNSPGAIYHMGPVGVGTDRIEPHAALTVGGNLACTGQFLHPSDRKFKQNIEEVNYREAMDRLSQLKIVQYEIKPEVAEKWGLTEEERNRVGVIAQELEKIIPDAVREVNDEEGDEFLQVDDSRIFYESAAAVKELCRLTGNLEYKIEEVEKISKKLSKLSKLNKNMGSMRSSLSIASKGSSGIASTCNGSSYLSCSRSTLSSSSPPPKEKNKGVDNPTGPNVRYTEGKSRRNHHRHCHHYCSRRGGHDGICSNKIIQSTIIFLVIVMAFCLIAMATLYILDWHKRHTASSAYPTNHPYGGRTPIHSADSNSTQRPNQGPGEMFITNHRPPSHHQRPRVNWKPDWPGGTPPPGLQPCVTLDCETFCCPNVYSTSNKMKKVTDVNGQPLELELLPNANTDTQQIGQDFGDTKPAAAAVEPDKSVAAEIDRPTGSVGGTSSGEQQHEEAQEQQLLEKKSIGQQQQGEDGNQRHFLRQRRDLKDVKSTNINNNNKNINSASAIVDDRQLKRAQALKTNKVSKVSLGSARIDIVGHNMTLTEKYCLPSSCDAKRGNFTFYIPVSMYMPLIPVHVQFRLNDRTQYLRYCGPVYEGPDSDAYCLGADRNTANRNIAEIEDSIREDVHEKPDKIFELPVGIFMGSAYKFRLGYSPILSCQDENGNDGDGPGSTSNFGHHQTFEQYTLIFYRTCSVETVL